MDLINNELIDKSYELRFTSYFGLMSSINKKCYHLWLADLQKWLREIHKIQVIIIPFAEDSTKENCKTIYHCFINPAHYYGFIDDIDSDVQSYTFEEALETGLLHALKLIEDGK